MAPVVRELARRRGEVVSRVCVTGQHRELLDDVLDVFEIVPEHDLDVMRANQSPTGVAAEVLRGLEPVLVNERPDWVLVQGDTTTAAVGALAAFYAGVRVGHVEAGLRSHEHREPFPEEVNRRVVGVTADLHFAPTDGARRNLLREGVPPASILLTGNPVIDALEHVLSLPPAPLPELAAIPAGERIVLLTAHRRESFGDPLRRICAAVDELTRRFPDVRFVYPVHPNPAVREVVAGAFAGNDRVTLLDPLGYHELVTLLDRCWLVLTDSGGLQEEAPSLGKPVLVLRDVTERLEGVEAGIVRLVGTDVKRIVEEATALFASPGEYALMSEAASPYGDGRAAARIVAALLGETAAETPATPAPSVTLASR